MVLADRAADPPEVALATEVAGGVPRPVGGIDHDQVRLPRGRRAVDTTGSVTDEAQLAAAVGAVVDGLGSLDIVFANAGIAEKRYALVDAPLADWQRIIDINLRAHVRAARLLVPHWKSTGAGYFVAVASAAGLLTQIGGAGYAVTKHAAVGFAEWLAVTYGDDGIGVSCVCPMAVDTPLMASIRDAADPGARLAANAVLRIEGYPAYLADGYAVRLHGYKFQEQLSATTDVCYYEPGGIVARAAYYLCKSAISRDARYAQMVLLYKDESEAMMRRAKITRQPGTQKVRV